MAFGPNSNDPRERRAFAHAKLDRFAQGEASSEEAWLAVVKAALTTKGRDSKFVERYAKIDARQNPYDPKASEKRYQDEILATEQAAAELLIEREVGEIAMTNIGVDDLTGAAAAIKDAVVALRLAAGYELSYNQICLGMYGAAAQLGILVDRREFGPAIPA